MNQKTRNLFDIRNGKLPVSYFDKLQAMMVGINDKGGELQDAMDEYSAAAEKLEGLVSEYNDLRSNLKDEVDEIAHEVRGAADTMREVHVDEMEVWASDIEELGEYEEHEFSARDYQFSVDIYDVELDALRAVKEAELTEIAPAPTIADIIRLKAINVFRACAGLKPLLELPKEE